MTDEQAEFDLTVNVFYRTGRAGAQRLSDGGGPFGFDIAVALMVDEPIREYDCDAVAETGCFAGNTTFYLARRYLGLPVYSCDTNRECALFTARRLAGCPNTEVTCEDSPGMLARVAFRHARPLFFLDAHWSKDWPRSGNARSHISAISCVAGRLPFSMRTGCGTGTSAS